jgi:hypothetical protein
MLYVVNKIVCESFIQFKVSNRISCVSFIANILTVKLLKN